MTGFEDLLPPELFSARRVGPAPMRAAGVDGSSPPKPAGTPSATAASDVVAPPQVAELPACPVDGVPDSVVDTWFNEADLDGDGRVADEEARAFFLTSGLAPQDLSKIWKLVKSPEVVAREGKGLTRHRFAQVLRLIALAQSGAPFTPDNTAAALHAATWAKLHGAPLPPPRIGSATQQAAAAAAAAAAVQQAAEPAVLQRPVLPTLAPTSAVANPFAEGDFLGSATLLDLAVDAAPASAHRLPPSVHNDDIDLFGLAALQDRAASLGAPTISSAAPAGVATAAPTDAAPAAAGAGVQEEPVMDRRFSRSMAVSSRASSKGGAAVRTGPLEPPVAFEARLPPLQPKVSAKLAMLAAGNGSLFAGPAVNGGLLQWGQPEGSMRRPLDAERNHNTLGRPGRLMSDLMGTPVEPHPPAEDADAAPCIEVAATDRGRAASCLLVDEAAGLLWVADKEGWVYAYDIGGEPGMCLRTAHRAHHFQAHRVGCVTAMCRTPRGHLWTGSSRGNLRIWELGSPALVGEAPEPPRCRELRKAAGERAHGSPVLRLVCPADGQLVWSASSKGVLLWDAACGAYMGYLHRPGGLAGAPRLAAQPSSSDLLAVSSVDRDGTRFKVDGAKGLDTDPITGYVVARPHSSEWARIAADQEAWAAQTDNNINELMERVSIGGSKVVQGAGRAVKLLGKLARGLGGASSGSADAPSKAAAAAAAARQPSSGSLGLAATAALADEDVPAPSGDAFVAGIVELVVPPDGSVWVAHRCGVVDRYTAGGRRLGTAECGAGLAAAACVGRQVWLGFLDGMVSVRDAACASLKVFQAHAAGVLSIAQAGTRTFTLAADGSLKGWSSAVPHPADLHALVSWDEQARGTYQRDTLRVLCVTWNVGESKPEPGSPFFCRVHDAANNVQLAVVGLQEIEMGGSSVALAAAKDAFSQRMQERGNTNAKFWSAGVLTALGGERHWHQVGLRQLSGMLVMVFARNDLKDAIGEVTTASVACGVLGVGGNKGAVAVEFSVHRRKVAVVCSHFAAHQGAVEARNANYATICRQLTFTQRSWYLDEPDAGPGALPSIPSMQQQAGSAKFRPAALMEEAIGGDVDSDADSSVGGGMDVVASSTAPPSLDGAAPACGEGLRGADMLVWLGDFNYRIDGQYHAVKAHIQRNELGVLRDMDQCRREMAAGRVFHGLREGPLHFPPTYKFDKGSPNPHAYDSSEKQRIPAWCDRIFFRGSKPFPSPEPVVGEQVGVENEEQDVAVRAVGYDWWADVSDSDHKPVFAVLEADLPITNQDKKRALCNQLLQECAAAALRGDSGDDTPTWAERAPTDTADAGQPPQCSLLPSHVKLHPTTIPQQMVLLRNEGPRPLLFSVSCDDGSPECADAGAASLGRPATDDAAAVAVAHQLLEVRPARGLLPPCQDVRLQVHLSGDEWMLRGVQRAPELRYVVRVGSEYSAGGKLHGPGTKQLCFTATCLTHL